MTILVTISANSLDDALDIAQAAHPTAHIRRRKLYIDDQPAPVGFVSTAGPDCTFFTSTPPPPPEGNDPMLGIKTKADPKVAEFRKCQKLVAKKTEVAAAVREASLKLTERKA